MVCTAWGLDLPLAELDVSAAAQGRRGVESRDRRVRGTRPRIAGCEIDAASNGQTTSSSPITSWAACSSSCARSRAGPLARSWASASMSRSARGLLEKIRSARLAGNGSCNGRRCRTLEECHRCQPHRVQYSRARAVRAGRAAAVRGRVAACGCLAGPADHRSGSGGGGARPCARHRSQRRADGGDASGPEEIHFRRCLREARGMSALLIDVGNTRVKWARFTNGKLRAQRAAAHEGWKFGDFARQVFQGARTSSRSSSSVWPARESRSAW